MKLSKNIVRCISCDLSCQLFPESSLRSHYCDYASFAIWPNGNHFLQLAVENKILRENKNHLSRGFIFVDFSLPNLRHFSDPQWIDRLAKANMNIVIITDRKLAPLANYWFTHRSEIQGIIHADDNDKILQEKIKSLFSGRSVNDKRGNTLNEAEMTLLHQFMSGAGLQQIIKTSSIDIKKIYVHKLRLERKLGASIHKILVSVL